ncbi:MAG: hypothetical protein ACPGVU_16405 [Limisphaerales bacterium]
MSLNASKSRLRSITGDLLNQWHDTHETWRDSKARDFEVEFLDEINSSVDHASNVISKLDEIVSKIRQDCE